MGNILYLNILFYTNFNLDLLVYCIEHKFHCLTDKDALYIKSNDGLIKWLLNASDIMDSTVI